MKLTAIFPLCAIVCGTVFAATPPPGTGAGTNLVDKGSYAFGATLGNNLRLQGAEPNIEEVIKGFRDGIAGKAKSTDTELRESYLAWQRDVRTQKMEQNKKAGEAFLAKKASEPEVKKLADGLLYKVITSGKGPQPKATDRVSAHYKGTLIDGTEFDSSYTRGQPYNTPVTRVVPGWQIALTNMHVGDKWESHIPSHLGYAERGAPSGKIGPNAALIFEMELLAILPPDTNDVITTPTLNLTPRGNGQGAPVRVAPGAGGNQPIRVTPNTGANPPVRVTPPPSAPATK